MKSDKNLLIQARRPGICSAFPLGLLLAYVEKVDCLGLMVLGTFLSLLLNLRNGLKITLSIIPIAVSRPWVEITHG